MDGYTVYKYMEFIIFSLYLIMIFLSIQVLFLWMDLDKKEFKSFLEESFMKNDTIVVFFAGVFFTFHELFDETNLQNSYLYFEFFELLGLICIVRSIFGKYCSMKPYAFRKPAHERLLEARRNTEGKHDTVPALSAPNFRMKSILALISGITGIIVLSVPISTLIFILVIGLLFIPPLLALTSTIIGASLVSRELWQG
ncbi:MAG TPA: hypothetical protein VIO11_00795 [Candidatus Methanoperedens sp.]